MEAINEGCKGDVLTLYGLSLLADVHTFIHLHNGQFWTTLKNVPSTHEETLRKCKVHALYLGRGLFVELMEWNIPLQIIDNPDPKVTSIVIGELTELEQKMYDDTLHTGLGSGITVEFKAGTSTSASVPKQGPNPPTDEPLDEAPLDLSVDDKDIPAMQLSSVLPLDLSFGQGSDDTQLLKSDTQLMKSEPLSSDITHETQATLDTSLHYSLPPKVMDQPDQKWVQNI